MRSNFEFLTGGWSVVREAAGGAERLARVEPRAAVFFARRALEAAVRHLYAVDRDLDAGDARSDGLNDLMNTGTFEDALPPRLYDEAHKLRKLGNDAVHKDFAVSEWTAKVAVKTLHTVLAWAHPVYTAGAAPAPAWDETLLPAPANAAALEQAAAEARREVGRIKEQAKTAEQTVEQVRLELAAAHAGRSQAEQDADGQRAAIAALQEQIAQVKASRRAEADARAEITATADEATTRSVLIDADLRRAGWAVGDAKQVGEEVDLGDAGRADYVLWGPDGLPQAVVEAKKAGRHADDGRTQAEGYAAALEARYGRRPLMYWTNGYETWLYDDRAFGESGYPPRKVSNFATRDGLALLIARRSQRKDLTAEDATLDRDICDRYYQAKAAKRVFEDFQGRRRKALLVMATGTGKTRTTVAMVEVLLRMGWVSRVLFLADRTALVRQARKAFAKHLPDVTTCNLLDEADKGQRIIFSTYPTMANAVDDGRFGADAFDLVIVDEAHRSVYQSYRPLFGHFDSLLLGLTATPRDQVDRNTYGLFELADGQPTYAYELETAVADGYLVPPVAVSVPVKFLREGMKYDDLSDAEKAEYEEKLADPETGEIPGEVYPAQMNTELFNADTVDKVLAHLMEHGHKIAGGDRLAKTILFAKNVDHARFVRDRFDKAYPERAGSFLRVVSHGDSAAQSLVEAFGDKPEPVIAASVDMLDTGVDVPEVANLVFFKLVRSKTKFWQMIGRGTRLCPNLYGPGRDKRDFRVFDFCGNLEFFQANPKGVEGKTQRPLAARVFDARLDLSEAAAGEDGESIVLRAGTLDALCLAVAGMNRENMLVRPHRRLVEKLSDRPAWDALTGEERTAAREDLATLPTAAGESDDEPTRRFDLLMLRLTLAVLADDPTQVKLGEKLRVLAERLEDKKSIPSVSAKLELIQAVQTDDWWAAARPATLERTRAELRDLARFITSGPGRAPVITEGIEEELGEPVTSTNLVQSDPSLAGYHRRVERFIREHQGHITIRRLTMNEPITAADLAGLEAILFSGEGVGDTRERFREEFGGEPLGLLVRKIVGLDRHAAKAALAEFLHEHALTGDQQRFVDEVVNRVVANGFIETADLGRKPFTDFHSKSVMGLFPQPERQLRLVRAVEAIKQRAMA